MAQSFEEKYPLVSEWVKQFGWIEIGHDDYSRSFVRVLDIGGMIWEGNESYESIDAMFNALEAAIGAWKDKNYSDR
jgi:hypothetical protein